MLVLTRRTGESIRIGDEIRIQVVDIQGNQVRLAIEAPRSIPVHREEVYQQVHDENVEAANLSPDTDPAALWQRNRDKRPKK